MDEEMVAEDKKSVRNDHFYVFWFFGILIWTWAIASKQTTKLQTHVLFPSVYEWLVTNAITDATQRWF